MDKKGGGETTPSPKLKRGGTLSREQYNLFVRYLTTKLRPSKSELKQANLLDSPQSKHKHGYGLSGRFLGWAKRMTLRETDNVLLLKRNGKEILCREDFESAVRQMNESFLGTHLSFSVTLRKMREKYTMGKREFGMNEDTIREVLFTCVKADCPCKKVKKVPREEVIGPQPIRETKSCSSLPNKTTSLPDTELNSSELERKGMASNLSTPSSDNKVFPTSTTAGNSSKPSVACYTVLNLADIVNLASQTMGQSEGNSVTAKNLILKYQNFNNNLTNVGTQLSLSKSFNQSAELPSIGARLQSSDLNTGTQSGNPNPTPTPIRPASDLRQRSILYRICANQQVLNNALSLASPNKMLPCVQRQLIGQASSEVKADSTDKDVRPSGSRSSMSDLDWESFTSLSVFAEALGGQTGLQECLSKAREASNARKQANSSCSPSDKSGHQSIGIPSFTIRGNLALPQPDMWYFYQDIVKETHRYKRLLCVIDDMKLEVRQSLMGIKPATERLKRKMAHAESLIQKCKAIACLREKLATDRRKRLHSVKATGDRSDGTDKSKLAA
ncbi:uncharacterized protein LOC135475255 [Liolophura sinensis]|uniref:uncharacterized protein LOC135475255 n=1 Tax=Liolophura sinensis TaxID=3198878 RepID=UPI00315919D4